MEKIYLLIDTLIQITNTKKEYFNKIYSITNQQKTCIENEDYDGLDRLIKEKQNIMGIVDKNDDTFNSIFVEIKNILAVDDISKVDTHRYPKFKELKLLIIEISNAAKDIETVDTINRELLQTEMDKVRANIDKMNSSKRVAKVYNNYGNSSPDSYFFDKKK